MLFLDIIEIVVLNGFFFFVKTRRIFFFNKTVFEKPKSSCFDTLKTKAKNGLILIAYRICPDDQRP